MGVGKLECTTSVASPTLGTPAFACRLEGRPISEGDIFDILVQVLERGDHRNSSVRETVVFRDSLCLLAAFALALPLQTRRSSDWRSAFSYYTSKLYIR